MKVHRAIINGQEVVRIPAVNSVRPPIAIEYLDDAALPPKNGNYEPVGNTHPNIVPLLGQSAAEHAMRVDSL